MVVLPHLKNYDDRFGGSLLPGRMFWVLGNAGVDLFFVISGFVMVTVAAGRSGQGEPSRFCSAARTEPIPLSSSAC